MPNYPRYSLTEVGRKAWEDAVKKAKEKSGEFFETPN
jgi:hypothetical protein